MATLRSSVLSFLLPPSLPSPTLEPSSFAASSVAFPPLCLVSSVNPRKLQITVPASHSDNAEGSSPLGDAFDSSSNFSKKPILANLIQEIEPLDVSLLQKDVPPTTLDAMKRTISGMLGLLPSDRFQVSIEALWEPLSKLLLSSMMTGYTLRNAEYRLCLERNLGIREGESENQTMKVSNFDLQEMLLESAKTNESPEGSKLSSDSANITEESYEEINVQGLGEMSPEAQRFILHLQSRLALAKKELHEAQRTNAALQIQQFVGDEQNDLLDYLRSLQPEKVAELSEPASPQLKDAIRSVVHGLLATLSPKMHSKAPPLSENAATGTVNVRNEDFAELIENTSLHFQPLISSERDYLARLLFWCMLLGHYLRGLEYRMELTELFDKQCSDGQVS